MVSKAKDSREIIPKCQHFLKPDLGDVGKKYIKVKKMVKQILEKNPINQLNDEPFY